MTSQGSAEAVQLSDLTTFHVGGAAGSYLRVTSAEQLRDAVAAADVQGTPVLVVGGGSNLLVGDAGFPGLVVQVASVGVEQLHQPGTVEGTNAAAPAAVYLRVAAGQPWDEFVAATVAQGWSGIEALSGIPGTVGAVPVQNVGAYGAEVATAIAAVRVWDRQERAETWLAAADCAFAYRSSLFKRATYVATPSRLASGSGDVTSLTGPRYVILEVDFALHASPLSAPIHYAELASRLGVAVGDQAELNNVRQTVLQLRRGKGMVAGPTVSALSASDVGGASAADHDTWSAGSFFTNPIVTAGVAAGLPDDAPRWPMSDGQVKLSAAWLIEHAGFGKGFGLPGPAALSTKHTLALTNRGDAHADDIVALARTVRDGVAHHFGVTLVPEPVFIGCAL